MEEIELRGQSFPFTRSIKAAAALATIGAQLRRNLAVTAVKSEGKPDDLIFFFEPGELEVSGDKAPVQDWLKWAICPWSEYPFAANHEHGMTYLKSYAQNRDVLVSLAKQAEAKPFRLITHGRRIMVFGAGISEQRIQAALARA